MTSQWLVPDLKMDEGFRRAAYGDPLTGGEPWTIAYGHTGGVKPGQMCTQAEADQWLLSDIEEAKRGLNRALPWWTTLDDIRQDVLVNMAFNLGTKGLLGFPHMLAAAKGGNYHVAADEMRNSKWAGQVHNRASRLANMMETGERVV